MTDLALHTKVLEYHYGQCTRIVGPRGGVRETREVWRRNGATKTWRTRPGHFSIPVKYGYRGPYSYITHENAADFHVWIDCPLRQP